MGILCRGCLLSVLLCVLLPAVCAAADDGRMTIDNADRLTYLHEQGLEATGRPHLTYQYFQLDADRVYYDLVAGMLTADGNVVMADTGMVTYGDRLVYDTRRQRGTIDTARLTYLPWRFNAARVERAERTTHARRVSMTTCDEADPHFHITSTSADLYPSTRLCVYNLVFWAGPVPVFYWPFYTRLLRDPYARWHVRPGYNKREGTFLKLGYDYYGYIDNVDGTLYADWYQRRGLGLGLDLDWTPAGGKHYLYFYHIAEKSIFQNAQTGKYYNPDLPRNDNWKLYLDGRQDFAGERRLLYYTNYLKQNDFNNDYNEGLTNRVERTLDAYSSFTQTRDDYTLRLSGEKNYAWSDSEARFRMTAEELPRLRFHWNTHALPWQQWYYQFDADLVRSRTAAADYEQLGATGELRALRSFTVTPRTTLTLNAGLNEQWENRRDAADKKDRSTARLVAGGDINYLLSNTYTLRLWHDFRLRLNNDDSMPFSGQERSQLQAGIYAYPAPTLRWQLTAGFDCRGETDAYRWRERWQPLRFGTFWFPRSDLDVSLEAFYDWSTNRVSRVLNENVWRVHDDLRFYGNAYHIDGRGAPNTTDLGAGMAWKWGHEPDPTRYWQLSAGTVWNVQATRFKETSITLTRRLHCWEAQLILADRSNGDREVWLLFNLADYPQRKLGLYRNADANRFNMTSTAFTQ